ncbi:MAG: site-specific DNA-methyltransferase [Caldisericia bacterium]
MKTKNINDFINKIICGDSLEIMQTIPSHSVDLILTDPDYNARNIGPRHRTYQNHNGPLSKKDYRAFCRRWFKEAKRIVKNNNIVLTPGIANTHNYPQPWWQVCWHKPAAVSFNRSGGFNVWEPIFYYTGPKIRIVQDYIKVNTLSWKKGPEKEHPCPKHSDVWGWAIRHFSKENDIVLDPFLGSGTTVKCCVEQNRKFIGIEIVKEYCEISEKRAHAVTEEFSSVRDF